MKVKIYWATRNWALIRRIREKYHLPQCMDVNGFTYADVDEETLKHLRKGEPEYLTVTKENRNEQ